VIERSHITHTVTHTLFQLNYRPTYIDFHNHFTVLSGSC